VLALAALTLGVPKAVALVIDGDAVRAAMANARLNRVVSRLHVLHGSLDAVGGRWPLVVANVLAAPLIEMAPSLATRVGHHGGLILSGIQAGLQSDVERAYRRVGMHVANVRMRAGWVALSFRASW
jgi:ribosomal protein L11 methyltransferase